MDRPEVVRLTGVPMPLRWSGSPLTVQADEDTLTITTGARTDWFVDPATGEVTATGCALLGGAPHREFTMTARVSVDFASEFDAGALVVRLTPDHWAKLAYEVSPQRKPMVVSVVTRGRSDDAAGLHIDADAVWLKLARRAGSYAFHASTDGQRWHFIRHFYLGEQDCEIGFLTQSPTGEGCRASFAHIGYLNDVVHDLHDTTHPPPLEYVVERDLPAPRDQVWQAWTEPRAFASWFGGTAATVSLDVRPGGRWRVDTSVDGEPGEAMAGRYLDVVDGQRLIMETSFAGGDTVMEMTFRDHAGGTRVQSRQRCRSTEELEGGRQGSEVLLAACADFVTGQKGR
ncbi:DUF1349 domain-containing protein [Qaidamihabitans albus]|uniref:DUF1349 domain-containing protein n=1 Tax=Qaidamihabitans albus TaxID=2795733 RepID=UPI0018F1208B|nr:DUF1349 domain-containing protein [Qaidamihabitans albus]